MYVYILYRFKTEVDDFSIYYFIIFSIDTRLMNLIKVYLIESILVNSKLTSSHSCLERIAIKRIKINIFFRFLNYIIRK